MLVNAMEGRLTDVGEFYGRRVTDVNSMEGSQRLTKFFGRRCRCR